MDTPAGNISGNSVITQTPGGKQRDENDWGNVRNPREKLDIEGGGTMTYDGLVTSKYTQSTPMFYTAEGHNLWV
jgi:hypothetical protein